MPYAFSPHPMNLPTLSDIPPSIGRAYPTSSTDGGAKGNILSPPAILRRTHRAAGVDVGYAKKGSRIHGTRGGGKGTEGRRGNAIRHPLCHLMR